MCILNGKKQKARPKEVKLKVQYPRHDFFFPKPPCLCFFFFLGGRREGGESERQICSWGDLVVVAGCQS